VVAGFAGQRFLVKVCRNRFADFRLLLHRFGGRRGWFFNGIKFLPGGTARWCRPAPATPWVRREIPTRGR
jgi:hypothetical protein